MLIPELTDAEIKQIGALILRLQPNRKFTAVELVNTIATVAKAAASTKEQVAARPDAAAENARATRAERQCLEDLVRKDANCPDSQTREKAKTAAARHGIKIDEEPTA